MLYKSPYKFCLVCGEGSQLVEVVAQDAKCMGDVKYLLVKDPDGGSDIWVEAATARPTF